MHTRHDFSNAKVGDTVYSLTLGVGRIIEINDNDIYSINVKFDNNSEIRFTKSGKYHTNDLYYNLSRVPFKIIYKDEELNKLKPFSKVLCKNHDSDKWRADIFLYYKKENAHKYICAKDCWKQCILYEGNEYLANNCENV